MKTFTPARRLTRALASIFAPAVIIPGGGKYPKYLGRHRTCDVAFPFRMPAGFPGSPNRAHPFSIVGRFPAAVNPLTFYGQPGVLNADGTVRAFVAGDAALVRMAGVTVRPYPFQSSVTTAPFASEAFGTANFNAVQALDLMVGGYIMVPVVGVPAPGGIVFIWIAAAAGAHVQGGFEAAATGGSTIAIDIDQAEWHSPPDSFGVAELRLKQI